MYTIDSIKNTVIERPTFILNWDNIVTHEECKTIIDFFNDMKKLNLVFTRQEEGQLAHHKSDNQCYLMEPEVIRHKAAGSLLTNVLDKIWKCYQEYIDKFSILTQESSPKQSITSVKIQRTRPGEGYHVWHYENEGRFDSGRFLVFTIYLNTVELGGETEFLYQMERVNAVEGRVSIFPAGFTHTHRGNPPLSGDKYIVTGWIEFVE